MRIALAIAAFSAALAAPVAAQGDLPRATVQTADLDLSTQAGQARLDKRLDQAIRRMCSVQGFDAELRRQETACRLAARADAAPKVALAIEAARTERFAAIELDVQG